MRSLKIQLEQALARRRAFRRNAELRRLVRGRPRGAHRGRRAALAPLRRRDFRLLWVGQALSSMGDQFALVALPWLALLLTHSPVALAGVLATIAVPRAALMLVGGIYIDRLSPRRVMLAADAVRLAVTTCAAVLVLAGATSLPLLYGLALVFGIADAFFFPAQQAIVPALVETDEIGAANALVQGTTQATILVGPVAAGALIATIGSDGGGLSLVGIGLALVVDALSYLASIVTLTLVGEHQRGSADEPLLEAAVSGVRFVWAWPSLRFVVLLAMGVSFLIVGPLNVGLPILAFRRLPEGAAAYGLLVSAMGVGGLAGMIAVAAGPRPRNDLLGSVVLAVLALVGVALAALTFVTSSLAAAGVSAVLGFGLGYGNLSLSTWAQQRVREELLGRVLSLVLLGSLALVPLSQVMAGALVDLDLEATLRLSGGAMAVLALWAATTTTIRGMGLEPTRVEARA